MTKRKSPDGRSSGKGGPRGPNISSVSKESAKPTPKSPKVPLSKQYAPAKVGWSPSEELRQPGGASALLTKVASDVNSLRKEHRKEHTLLLVVLYEIASHLRDNASAFAEFRNLPIWEKHPKFRPPANGQPDALKYAFRYAAGFSGAVSNDRSSRWTRALTPAFEDRLPPSEVLKLIMKSGGIKKLASENRGSGDVQTTGVADSIVGSGSGLGNTSGTGHRKADTPLPARMLEFKKALRNLETVGLAELAKRMT